MAGLPVLREIGQPGHFGHGPWRVRVRDAYDRPRSVRHCWTSAEAFGIAAQLKASYPEYKIGVRRLGRRREVAA